MYWEELLCPLRHQRCAVRLRHRITPKPGIGSRQSPGRARRQLRRASGDAHGNDLVGSSAHFLAPLRALSFTVLSHGLRCIVQCVVDFRRYQNPELVLFPERIAIPWDNATCANSDWTFIADGMVTRSQEDWAQWADSDRTTVVDSSSCIDVLWERRSTLRQAVLDCAQVTFAR